jgi:hypothetical protein
MEGNFFVAARVVTSSALAREDHSFHICLSIYHSILTKCDLFVPRQSDQSSSSTVRRLVAAPVRSVEISRAENDRIRIHHPFMHVWCEIGVAVVERMDYLFCTVFAWKLTNKKFETVAI